MHNHFDQHLNLKQMILDRKPKRIVECGAGQGDLTRKIGSILDECPFEFYVINDHAIDGIDPRVRWITDISYEALRSFQDDSIDFCIIDTDHNYWTLTKELESVGPKMTEGGLIALHDVMTFYHDTGMAGSYWNEKPYPREAILAHAIYGSLGDALIEFLFRNKMNFRLYAWNPESNVAAILEKRYEPVFAIKGPGPKAIFAKKENTHAVLQAG